MLSPPIVTASVSGLQAGALAGPARDLAHELLELVALGVGLGLRVAPLDVGDARPRRWCGTSAAGRTGSCSGRGSARSEPYSRISRCRLRAASSTACRVDEPVRLGHRLEHAGSSTRAWRSPRARCAPSSIDRSGSGTTSSGSTSSRVPSPSHVGHAPYGELNEKLRGASSSNEMPVEGAGELLAEGLDAPRRRRAVWTAMARDALGELERGLDRVGHPPADVGLGDQAVDDHLDRVLVGLRSSRIGSASSRTSPSIRARANPLRARSSSSFSYSPLRPRTMGASTWNRVPSGSSHAPGRRSARASGGRSGGRSWGSAGGRPGRTAPGGSRRPR